MQRLSIMEHPAIKHPADWPAPRRHRAEREDSRAFWWLALAGLCCCAFAAGWLIPSIFRRLPAQHETKSAVVRNAVAPVAPTAATTDVSVPEQPTPPVSNGSESTAANAPAPANRSPFPSAPAPASVSTAPVPAANASIPNTAADFHNRSRARFLAALGETQEIVPGLQFHIDRIITPTNHFDGWLQSTDGTGRALSLENVSLLQAIPFSGKDGRRFDLIVTDLRPERLTGYVILPPN